jgi:hypothetical protein
MTLSRLRFFRVEPLGFILSVALGIATPKAVLAQAQPPSGGQLQQQLTLPPAPASASKPSIAIKQPTQARSANKTPIPVRLIEITGNTLLPTAQLHALVASAEESPSSITTTATRWRAPTSRRSASRMARSCSRSSRPVTARCGSTIGAGHPTGPCARAWLHLPPARR